MSEKEKIEFYIAMCKCCLLAQTMRNCPLCRFNIGLAEQVRLVNPMPLQTQTYITVFATAE